ncbi:MAG: tetratricopeptide repeat protein [Phycisphaerales bacterium JB060]
MRAATQTWIAFSGALMLALAAAHASPTAAVQPEGDTQDTQPGDTSDPASPTEVEETARLLNEMYGLNVNVGTPEGVAVAMVRCTTRGVGDARVDGSFALVVRDEVVLVPLARLLRGESVMVKAACCEQRPATGVYAFDARAGLALLAVPGLQAPAWTGGYAELASPAPDAVTARVGFPLEIAGSLGIGTSTLPVLRDREDALRGRRLRLDLPFSTFGSGAIVIDGNGRPVAISTEWAGNNKSWAVPIAGFLDAHLESKLDDSKLVSFDKLIDNAPDDRAKSIMLTLRAKSEPDQLALLDLAIDLEPGNALAHYHRGVVLDMMGDKPGSISALERTVEIDDQWSESWYSLGLVRLTSGDPRPAGEDFARATELDDTHADAHGMRGVAAMHAGDAARAIEPMRRAIEIEPDRMQFAMNLELAYEQSDRGDEAYKAWEAYVAAEPDDKRGHVRYCRRLAVGLQLGKLLEVATAGLERFGENADDLAYRAFALGFSEPRDAVQARELAGRALELEPGHQVATLVIDRVR